MEPAPLWIISSKHTAGGASYFCEARKVMKILPGESWDTARRSSDTRFPMTQTWSIWATLTARTPAKPCNVYWIGMYYLTQFLQAMTIQLLGLWLRCNQRVSVSPRIYLWLALIIPLWHSISPPH